MKPTERSKDLYSACVDKDWEAAITLCSCEAQSVDTVNFNAHYQDERGKTCLHEALDKEAPCEVIRAIVDAHKEYPVRITRITDNDERTALHIAAARFSCSHNKVAVIELLVESDPHCATLPDNRGYTPLLTVVASTKTCYSNDTDEESALKVACARALLNASTTESILSSDNYNTTALHRACFESRIPPDIVKTILERFPQAALAKDSCGDTPLHCIMCFNVDDIIYGWSDDNDGIICAKMALLLESLTIQGKSGAVAVNNDGETPLHYAISYSRKYAIKPLIDAQPESVFIKDNDGMTPLDYEQENCAEFLQYLLREHGTAACSSPLFIARCKEMCDRCDLFIKPMLSVQHESDNSTVEESLWMTTEQENDINEEQLERRMIHNYLRLGSECPLQFVYFLQIMCPHQAQMKDARGVLPLHIALENGVQHAKLKTIYDYEGASIDINGSSVIKALIDVYPQAAKVPNRNGDLPFHFLLQNRADDSEWYCSAQPLLRAHPAALLCEEISLMLVLLPLILSRVGEGNDLSAVYELVREMPHLFFEVNETTTLFSEQQLCDLQSLHIE